MKIKYPGLTLEPHGKKKRYRVRVKGKPGCKITIHCGPDHPEFHNQYLAARSGVKPEPISKASDHATKGSIVWLINKHLEDYHRQVDQGLRSRKTLNKKRYLFKPLLAQPDKVMMIPTHVLEEMRDEMADRPSQADAFILGMRVMYDWAMRRKLVTSNPARGIEFIAPKAKGATPWTSAEVLQFLEYHKEGSKPHVALNILLWTGCRIEDLTHMGRHNEVIVEGVEAIRFQPRKKGSAEVTVPFAPAMKKAVRAQKVQGMTYMLTQHGTPFASGDSMSAMFIRWCKQAGLKNRSAHGIRKAVGEILAEQGCTQYEIMAVHGHTQSATSEIYTKGVQRWRLAQGAMRKMMKANNW